MAAHLGWCPWHLQPQTGAVTPGVVQLPDLPVVFPAKGQGSGEIRLGLGQGGQRCLRLLEGGLILLAMGDQSVLIQGPLVHVGCRRVCQMGSVVQLLSLTDDTVVEAPHLNPLCFIWPRREGQGQSVSRRLLPDRASTAGGPPP